MHQLGKNGKSGALIIDAGQVMCDVSKCMVHVVMNILLKMPQYY